MSKSLIIGIVGGGLGGLALAQLLRDSGHQVIIFERDENAAAREQGYGIAIAPAGLDALRPIFKHIPDLESFVKTSSLPGITGYDWNLKHIITLSILLERHAVSRWGLREVLTKDLDIRWNKRFNSYEEKENEVVIKFTDGTESKVDFLLGADGANSKLREQRFPALKYEPVGVANYAGVADPKTVDPEIAALLISGVIRIHGKWNGTGTVITMIMHRNHKTNEMRMLWDISSKVPAGYNPDEKQLRVDCLQLARINFHPAVARMIEQTERMLPLWITGSGVYTPEMKIPPSPFSRVSLLGDSAHPMTPNGGMGANSAFLDAGDLNLALRRPDWQNAVREYEETMFTRGKKNALMSLGRTHSIHTPGIKALISLNIFWFIGRLVMLYAWLFPNKVKGFTEK